MPFVILMRRRHLNNTTFCVSQTCHTKEGEHYTKYDIKCHVVFYVTMVNLFGMTLLMNKWTNIAMHRDG
jgi:hypothetical protein